MGMMVASIEAAKYALAGLPNVEIVTLLIIMYTLFLGKKVFYVIFAFVGLECFTWGFGLWTIMYLYVWPVIGLVALLFRKQTSVWFWSIFSCIFGLLFGALSSIPYLFIGGLPTAFAWWIAGIPWDMVHGISNLILTLVLFLPLKRILQKLKPLINENKNME